MDEIVGQLEACRTCANFFISTEIEFVSLFEPQHEQNRKELEFIQNELGAWDLTASANDGLPQRICGNCYNRFCSVFAFRQDCEEAQQKFHQTMFHDDMLDFSSQFDFSTNNFLTNGVPPKANEVVVDNEITNEVEVPYTQAQTAFAGYENVFSELSNASLMQTTPSNDELDAKILDVSSEVDMLSTFADSLQQQMPTPSLHQVPALSPQQQVPALSPQQQVPALSPPQQVFAFTLQQQVPTHNLQQQVPSPSLQQQVPSPSLQQQVPSPSLQQQVPSPSLQQQVPCSSLQQQVPSPSPQQQLPALSLQQQVPTLSLQQLVPAAKDVHSKEANISVYSKTKQEEIYDAEPLDFEEMLQGSIIPTGSANKKKALENEDTNSLKSEPMETSEGNGYMNLPQSRVSGNALACQYCYCPPEGSVDKLIFPSPEALSQHFFAEHVPNLPYTCPRCSATFNSAYSRDKHLRRKHEPLAYGEMCIYCLRPMRTRQDSHESNCEFLGDWQCVTCGMTFNNAPLFRFRAHERLHDSNKHFSCLDCPRNFSRRSDLKEHRRMHLKDEATMVICGICTAAFGTDYEKKRHMYQLHNGPLPVMCEFCKKGFVTQAFLNRHLKHIHPQQTSTDNSDDAVTCTNCKTKFKSLHKLRNHISRPRDENGQCIDTEAQKMEKRRQQRQGIFPCPHCSKRFHIKNQLQKHLNTHDERLRPFQCEQCHIRCRSQTELEQHVNVAHLDVKPYECLTCGKNFGYKSDLHHHMLSHSDLNTHCTETGCNYVCKNRKALNDHIRHKHRLRNCDYCGETFTRQRLIAHLRQVHRADVDLEFVGAEENAIDVSEDYTVTTINNIPPIVNGEQEAKGSVELLNPVPDVNISLLDFHTEMSIDDFKPLELADTDADRYFFDSIIEQDPEIIVT